MTIQAIFGIAAGIVTLLSFGVYATDILKGNTKPSRVTWWVLALSNTMIAASYYASGARDTMWVPLSFVVIFLLTALLSIRYGQGGWTFLDKIAIFGTVASALLWVFVGSPQLALLALVLVEFFGLIPTIHKAYREPWTESKASWTIATFASLLNVFAIETWTIAVAAYPIYVFITNAIVMAPLVFSRKRQAV